MPLQIEESEEAIVLMMVETTKLSRKEGPLLLSGLVMQEVLRDCESSKHGI